MGFEPLTSVISTMREKRMIREVVKWSGPESTETFGIGDHKDKRVQEKKMAELKD